MSEHPTNAPLVVVHPDKQGVSDAAGARLLLALLDTLCVRDDAHVVLTGGSLGSDMLASAGRSPLARLVDWSRVRVLLCVKFCVHDGDPDRNRTEFYRLLQKHALTPGLFKADGAPGPTDASP